MAKRKIILPTEISAWEELRKNESEQYKAAYIRFMCNKTNECKCESCPHANDMENTRYPYYPCGQQNCWVTCHCK